MILNQKQTTLAYRCPHCGSAVTSLVGVFSLSADMIRMKCPCGESDLSVVYTKDKKVRLSVPCFLCPKPHTFTLSSQLFFETDLMAFPCPYSGINICFMGDSNYVKAELARNELELLDMLEENGIESFRDLDADEAALPDPQIMEIVTFVIHDLDAEGKIYCKCHPEGSTETAPADSFDLASPYDGDYAAELTADGLRVYCKKCGAQKIVPTNSLISAHDFLNCDSLTLE